MQTRITQLQLVIVWLVLLLLGGLSLLATEVGFHGLSFSLVLLLVAALKIQLVADWYMGLRETRKFWRLIIAGWLLLVLGLIAIAFALTA